MSLLGFEAGAGVLVAGFALVTPFLVWLALLAPCLALGNAVSRVLAAAVLSCAGVCAFFIGVAVFFETPFGLAALLTVGGALDLGLALVLAAPLRLVGVPL